MASYGMAAQRRVSMQLNWSREAYTDECMPADGEGGGGGGGGS